MVLRQTRFSKPACILLFLLLLTNVLLYQPAVQRSLSISLDPGVIAGSMLDLLIVMPLLVLAAFRLKKRYMVAVLFFGILLVNLLVPSAYHAMVRPVFYTGLAVEGLLFIAELSLLGLAIWKIPKIRRHIRESESPLLFSAVPAVTKNINHALILRIFTHEFLMFYYAITGFWKKPIEHAGTVTMHKKTSVIAIQLMLIHAIVLETIGLHWWLHGKWPVISIILLILNIYSILLFLAELQIARLIPLEIKNGKLYVAQGIRQQMTVELSNIERVEWSDEIYPDTTLFAYQDFEQPLPQLTIYFKEPVELTLFYGKTKPINHASFCVDEPEKLRRLLEQDNV
ncbi:hypothetical protein KP77_08470 [Jeotgalibacillus alimentarius]|uniref:Beta-carotene 15,15'-monooxygenase n=1 Tax=Jeotgalibacillus alimentarius TaxID=135826 RepID=A0A0C2RM30_9BACL|nr:hypothetical protein [Jeotgalibacillus alimentarius]KIL51335.1 hypothetical protein KP77_08470 [Jeotgalibacillus alimentarius]